MKEQLEEEEEQQKQGEEEEERSWTVFTISVWFCSNDPFCFIL